MKKVKISIIVPVYNISKYISSCIDSIISQKYNNYELILVDDGSKDDSGNICDEYALKKSNINVIHKKNGGLSSARNTGIEAATGEYLMFIDGDDFLYNDECLSKIADYIDKNKSTDIIQYKMVYFYEKNEKYLKFANYENIDENDYVKMLKNLNSDKIIKTSIIKDNDLYFEDGLLSEDIDWSLKLYMVTKTISLLNEDIYVYRQQRVGSISTGKNKKHCQDLYFIIDKWFNYNYEDEKIKNLYYNYLAYQLLILITILDKKNFDKNALDNIDRMFKSLMNYDENYKVKKFNSVRKIFGNAIAKLMLKVYLASKNKGILKL